MHPRAPSPPVVRYNMAEWFNVSERLGRYISKNDALKMMKISVAWMIESAICALF